MLVAWNFGHAEPSPQRLDDHLLLDCRGVLDEIQLPQDGCADGAKAVLALAQPALEAPVDAGRDERAAGQPKELVEAAMQLARSAFEARAGDVVGSIGADGLDEQRNILWIVRAVGIDEYRNRRADVWDRAPDGLAFPRSGISNDLRAACGGKLRGAVGRSPRDDNHFACIGTRSRDDIGDAGAFLFGSDDGADVGEDVARRSLVQVRLNDRVGVTGHLHRASPDVGDGTGTGAAVERWCVLHRPARIFPRMV